MSKLKKILTNVALFLAGYIVVYWLWEIITIPFVEAYRAIFK